MALNTSFLIKTFFAALKGIPVSILITVLSLLLAALPALFMALARLYNIKFFAKFVKLYVSFIRGTPMVVQILIIYSFLPSMINQFILQFNISFNVFDTNPIIYAVTVFTLHTTATLSEVIRSAIITVDHGQMDASIVLGMKPFQAFRLIILPQAAVEAIPNLGTLTINLFKETSLSFLMTVKDITAIAKIEASYGYNYIEAYLDIFIIYLIVCSGIQIIFYYAEKIIHKK